MLRENQLVELMDGSSFIILDSVSFQERTYLYVAKVDDDLNPSGEFDIVMESIIEEVPTLDYVEDEELYESLKATFLERSEIDSNI